MRINSTYSMFVEVEYMTTDKLIILILVEDKRMQK